ncbi:MAG TPA: UDP-2,3-diacylglucosamine diphosphatase [Paludibacteraceae bacterium]|jgi:UDP-2,3-diacylglucosamine hydrolase|nr:UDP-2,3-diacylglucosamine diphosphatase [Paludibacteraceae bacterium]HOU67435.1 UDP-2,3-diacylglucosamine diphosphatase [Paludibacteraceae bacterium]HPH63575.1 UDP-2,3-diacylglucosamine diphosphatase [Paludibacteraceae bacterium]HQF49473.1 UDP-2,3-diacylglucosamine diphosphatase [Paludibacteraceae bacterium]HQJ89610.1 UDP-2,3-diacylglucosamine diphosphatase [Paludibacteraceae bacterium]
MEEGRKKIYFASDAHLGLDVIENPLDSERRLVRWLDSIKKDASSLFLLGDMFDYWFEYKYVVPKGFTRFLGKLGELSDMGVKIYIFIGNHDIWMFDYLPKEIGAVVVREPMTIELMGKKFFLAHGDGLGDPNKMFRFIRRFFRNKLCQRLYKGINPWFTIPLGQTWSRHSRSSKLGSEEESYLGEDREYLVKFAKEDAKTNNVDYYIFGHRHIMLDLAMADKKRVVILGDWITNFSYASFDGSELRLSVFEENGNQ